MKKLYFILAFIMSSFFFCTSVSASTFNYTITETDINRLLSEDFILLREKTIEHCEANNLYYVISWDVSNYRYSSYVFEANNYNLISTLYATVLDPWPATSDYYINNGNFYQFGTSSGRQIMFADNNYVYYYNFLDTNLESLIYTGSHEFIIQYNDTTYTISQGSEFSSLYKIYSNSITEEEEPEEIPEYEILTNFYTVIFEKLDLLTTSIAENYVFLSIFVVFILIFVIELIRRYLM